MQPSGSDLAAPPRGPWLGVLAYPTCRRLRTTRCDRCGVALDGRAAWFVRTEGEGRRSLLRRAARCGELNASASLMSMIRGVFGRERWFVSELLKTLVVLGARGDMTGRLLLPALVQLAGSGELPESLQVLAVDRDASDDDAYRDHARGQARRSPPRPRRQGGRRPVRAPDVPAADVTSARRPAGRARRPLAPWRCTSRCRTCSSGPPSRPLPTPACPRHGGRRPEAVRRGPRRRQGPQRVDRAVVRRAPCVRAVFAVTIRPYTSPRR